MPDFNPQPLTTSRILTLLRHIREDMRAGNMTAKAHHAEKWLFVTYYLDFIRAAR